MNTRYERALALLETVARQQGWVYEQGVARVTRHFCIQLEKSGSASMSGIIVRVSGDRSRMAAKYQRSWRRLSGTNNRADARTVLELAHSLAHKEKMFMDEMKGNQEAEEELQRQRQAVAELAMAFTEATGRTVATMIWGTPEATSTNYLIKPEVQESEMRDSYVKWIRITPEMTQFELEVPNDRAAEFYNFIEAAHTIRKNRIEG